MLMMASNDVSIVLSVGHCSLAGADCTGDSLAGTSLLSICAACCVQAKLLRRCVDLAAGLAYLHSRNVCHGDLKCENILLRSGTCVMLSDAHAVLS